MSSRSFAWWLAFWRSVKEEAPSAVRTQSVISCDGWCEKLKSPERRSWDSVFIGLDTFRWVVQVSKFWREKVNVGEENLPKLHYIKIFLNSLWVFEAYSWSSLVSASSRFSLKNALRSSVASFQTIDKFSADKACKLSKLDLTSSMHSWS